MKKLVIGILAHVDAGKTTLSEAMLYFGGSLRTIGRVDHKNAFLDTFQLERERGITIFSKQAVFEYAQTQITLLDTPGHVDFSAEMERALQVLDYAILVINGADGVQGHTLTLWKLLRYYRIPVFLFINKMDQEGTDQEQLFCQLKDVLDENCIDFTEERDQNTFLEALAIREEKLLESYLETGEVEDSEVIRLISQRKVFPCYFGSALKLTGVEEFLNGICGYTTSKSYPEEFGARVFKIARDEQGKRLTYLKVTGGNLRVKNRISGMNRDRTESWEEKADQIRIYSGDRYRSVEEAGAGDICAVIGLSQTYPGQGLGSEVTFQLPILEPILMYQIQLPPECDVHKTLILLRQLEEEDPELHIVWNEKLNEIHAQIMGEVQIEVLKNIIWERFHLEVEFGTGNIVYKETITSTVEGVGHFEPLRHYAEVHLLLEPGERGSGIQLLTSCSEDVLDRNWQRQILSYLEDREHSGVLTGSGITDIKITLLTGKAHRKHTEGGDFRQAACRAVRQGLMQAKSILLEPYYEFRLEIPSEMIGRAMSDIQKMYGQFANPETKGEQTVLTGSCPVATMRDYQREVNSYSRGRGRLFCSLQGYSTCHNEEEVIAAIGYDPEADAENPSGSVFCAHGSGFTVKWNQVKDYMHVESDLILEKESDETEELVSSMKGTASEKKDNWVSEKELEDIFERTYGPVKSSLDNQPRRITRQKAVNQDGSNWKNQSGKKRKQEEYLLVDGYNIIFAWEELQNLAEDNMDGARTRLMDILCNYQAFRQCTLILVFDAYKVKGNPGSVQKYNNIYVVYTKEAETADQYIEKTVHQIGKEYHVTVATSDRMEQMIILGSGGIRLSARGLYEEIQRINLLIKTEYLEQDH